MGKIIADAVTRRSAARPRKIMLFQYHRYRYLAAHGNCNSEFRAGVSDIAVSLDGGSQLVVLHYEKE